MTTSSALKLAQHIKNLKAKESPTSKGVARSKTAIIFWGASADKEYLPYLKGCVGSYTTHVRTDKITTLTTVRMYCKTKGVTKVVTSSPELLRLLLVWTKVKAPSLDAYLGSYFTIPAMDTDSPPIEVVFIQPLKRLVTVNHEQLVTSRAITKLTHPEKWYKPAPFKWEMLLQETEDRLFSQFESAFLIAVDIETFQENATIRCISYCGFWYAEDGSIKSLSVVLPLDSEYNLAVMRKWNGKLTAPKVLQNGNYDNSYLARYSAPLYNYLYDTANLFHSWYSELPKNLGFLNGFFVREAVYWKDLGDTNDLHEYYKYNALDTWGTGNCFLAMMLEMPRHAFNNYLLEFPLVFPCHLSEMTGIERDMEVLIPAREELDKQIEILSDRLDVILGVANFNVKSSPNKKALFKLLGCSDLKKQDESNIQKARHRHPFNAYVLGIVLEVIGLRTLREKYLQVGEKAKEFHRLDGTGNRILFALKPHGTDTARLASSEHHFWCGLQIQNIPRGPSVKCTLKADPGFSIAEADLEQAESRDTAYISGDANLIEAVEHSPDFHSYNASKFFGVPFEEIYDALTHTVLNKSLRQIGKPVNHGANYNMGATVLVETMGEQKVKEARYLLGLHSGLSYFQVAEHLLAQFHKTYPAIRGVMYAGLTEEIVRTRRLESQAVHYSTNTDEIVYKEALSMNPRWTRICFGHPDRNKKDLNSYIAHPPSNLNAITLNKAYMTVFKDIAMNPRYAPHFKLIAQIHDSILYQYRLGHAYINDMIKERLEIPVTIRAYDGVIRSFVVPAGVKNGDAANGNPSLYWSDTE